MLIAKWIVVRLPNGQFGVFSRLLWPMRLEHEGLTA